jgi:hypothetical protein
MLPELHLLERERLGVAFIAYALPLVLIAIVYTVPLLLQGMASDSHDLITYCLRYVSWSQHPFSSWNSIWSGGMPVVASPHDDRYYPFSFPFYLIFQNIQVMNLILLGHVYIAYLTMRRLAGLATRDNLLLLLAGISYAFSGMILARIDIGHTILVFALAWLPLVYDSFLRVLEQKAGPTAGALLLALSFTLLFFTGGLYYVVYACIFMGIILLCYAATRSLPRGAVISMVAGGSLAFLLTAVKSVPDIIISPYLERIDPINPLAGGGSLEAALASFVSGASINPVFGHWESAVLVGAVPLIFASVTLLFGKRKVALAGFACILFAVAWADGGRSVLSFMHLIPVVSDFRAPGRIFGAVLPLVLLMAVYGVMIVADRVRRGEGLTLDQGGKKRLMWGVGLLLAVKILEVPWQKPPGIAEVGAVVIIIGFLALVASGRADCKTIPAYTAVAVVAQILILAVSPPGVHPPDLTGAVLIAVVITAGCYALLQWRPLPASMNWLCIILVASLIISIIGATSFVSVHDPVITGSPMKAVVEEITRQGSANPLITIMETGRKFEHGDLAYWAAVAGIQHTDAYYPYFLINAPDNVYLIDGTNYYLADYLVDTAALEKGGVPMDNATFHAGGVAVRRLSPPLPSAFVMRGGSLVPSELSIFTPDTVVLSGSFLEGDTAVLKYAFAPGWTINGIAATRLNNLTAAALPGDSSSVTFRFDPPYFWLGAVLSFAGAAGAVLLFIFRRRFDRFCGVTENPKDPETPSPS